VQQGNLSVKKYNEKIKKYAASINLYGGWQNIYAYIADPPPGGAIKGRM
jgi:hypothetical protein